MAGGAAGASDTAAILDRLFELIEARRQARPDGSYVVSLLDGGLEAIEAKVREETEELVVAAREESDAALAHEAADLLFHVWVLLAARGTSPQAVYAELARRFGVGGLAEKAARVGHVGAAASRETGSRESEDR